MNAYENYLVLQAENVIARLPVNLFSAKTKREPKLRLHGSCARSLLFIFLLGLSLEMRSLQHYLDFVISFTPATITVPGVSFV